MYLLFLSLSLLQLINIILGLSFLIIMALVCFIANKKQCDTEDESICINTSVIGVILLVIAAAVAGIYIPLMVYTKRCYNYVRAKEVCTLSLVLNIFDIP